MIREPPRSTLFPCTTLFRACTFDRPVPVEVVLSTDVLHRCARGAPVSNQGRTHRPTAAANSRRTPRSSHPGNSCRSEEHTSELQSRQYLVCRLLLEKKKNSN